MAGHGGQIVVRGAEKNPSDLRGICSSEIGRYSGPQRFADQEDAALAFELLQTVSGSGEDSFLAGRTGPAVITRVLQDINIQRGCALQPIGIRRPVQCTARVAVQNENLPLGWLGFAQSLPANKLSAGVVPDLEIETRSQLQRRCSRVLAWKVKEPSLRQCQPHTNDQINARHDDDCVHSFAPEAGFSWHTCSANPKAGATARRCC